MSCVPNAAENMASARLRDRDRALRVGGAGLARVAYTPNLGIGMIFRCEKWRCVQWGTKTGG